jgi:hypothetical protein
LIARYVRGGEGQKQSENPTSLGGWGLNGIFLFCFDDSLDLSNNNPWYFEKSVDMDE